MSLRCLDVELDDAERIARTGDVWLFTGHQLADRAIRAATNAPVNHVAMVLALDDLPPLLWHAELGRSLVDVWTGEHHRGAQLHRLRDAADRWVNRYGQTAFFRQIEPEVSREQEDAALRVVSEMSGRSFPSSPRLASHWLRGRVRRATNLEDVYCAELVALSYQRMGLLGERRPPNWYDPGRFWSGDRLELAGASLGPEVAVEVPPPVVDRPSAEDDAGGDGRRPAGGRVRSGFRGVARRVGRRRPGSATDDGAITPPTPTSPPGDPER